MFQGNYNDIILHGECIYDSITMFMVSGYTECLYTLFKKDLFSGVGGRRDGPPINYLQKNNQNDQI